MNITIWTMTCQLRILYRISIALLPLKQISYNAQMNPFQKNADFFLDSWCRGLCHWAKKLIDLSMWYHRTLHHYSECIQVFWKLLSPSVSFAFAFNFSFKNFLALVRKQSCLQKVYSKKSSLKPTSAEVWTFRYDCTGLNRII